MTMTASSAMDFHSQIASIMEVLANAAVAEICKLVDDGYAVVHLETSRSQKENEVLRRKIKLLELQVARLRGTERVKGAEGSTGCRFPGVRLLNWQNREPLAEPLLQARTRFLSRDTGAQLSLLKNPPIDLDQDPDQEVVTTTKSEPVESEDDAEILIVKVESPTDSPDDQVPADGYNSSSRDASTLKDASNSGPVGCRDVMEDQESVSNMKSPKSEEEKMDGVRDKTLLDQQETIKTEEVEQPSCSADSNSSLCQIKTNSTRELPRSNRDQCDTDQANPTTNLNVIVFNTPPCPAKDGRSEVISSGERSALGVGIENRFHLRTVPNWLIPSTSFAFMLNNSPINALLPRALQNVTPLQEGASTNDNRGAKGEITAESCIRQRRKRSKVWLNFTKNAANGATCNVCSAVISCKGGNTSNMLKHLWTHGIKHQKPHHGTPDV